MLIHSFHANFIDLSYVKSKKLKTYGAELIKFEVNYHFTANKANLDQRAQMPPVISTICALDVL